MTKPLTKQSEKRILDALDVTSDLINEGIHPDDAIVKAATELKVPKGHIQLMVNAINTGATNAKRQNASTLEEKAASFPLANTENIMNKMYPDEVKTKKEAYVSTVVSDEYSRAPTWNKAIKSREKAAACLDWKMTDKKIEIETDEFLPMKKAMATIQKLTKEAETKRLELAKVRETSIKLASQLDEYFSSVDHIPFEEVKDNSVIYFGKVAETVLTHIKPREHRSVYTKVASIRPFSLNIAPYSIINDVIENAKKFATASNDYKLAVKIANEEAVKLLAPFARGPESGCSVLGNQLSAEILEKDAGIGGAFMGGLNYMNTSKIVGEIAKKSPLSFHAKDELVSDDYASLTDPAHESEIRNIQSEALLNDLMANDEIISGYDPEEVIDAYNEISQIAPFSADKKAIIRDLMRRRLAGGPQALDQFTVADMLKSQDLMRRINMPQDTYSKSVLNKDE